MAFQSHSFFLLACFISCISLCFGDDSVIIDLVNRVKLLANEGAHQRQLLQEHRTDLQMLHTVVHQQNTRLEYQTRLIKDYMKRVNVLEMNLAVLQNVESESKEITQDAVQTNGSLTQPGEQNSKHEMQSLKVYDNEPAEQKKEKIRHTREVDTPVAFQAVFRDAGQSNIGLNQMIVFPDVITNLGGGYHNHLGVFIAPRSGVYIFSTSIWSAMNSYMHVNIMVNGNRLASAMAVGNTLALNGQGTVTALSQLAANDEVWISLKSPAGSSLQGDHYSTFMGCLVYPFQN